MAFGSEYKSGSGAFFGAPIAIASENPLDPRMVVENYEDLIKLNSWAIQGTDTGNKGFNTAYHGMITAVKAPADKAGLYQLVKSSESSTAKADLQSYDNWQKISVSESEFTAILNRVSAVETSNAKKLDKDFVTNSSQGTLGEGTTFAARSDNTASATNVYITGKQIKDFAAAAVSDKGTFADDTALKAAYPTPEDGWSATVLSTGTTWISADGQWTDSGKSNGVTSVNGKSGKVTLVAADIDDVLSDTETDEHIQAAFTADREDLNTTAKSVVGGINEVKGVADAAAKADASNITVATWKEKLGFITASEVPEQVQPDWNAKTGKGQILNKPDISTRTYSWLQYQDDYAGTRFVDIPLTKLNGGGYAIHGSSSLVGGIYNIIKMSSNAFGSGTYWSVIIKDSYGCVMSIDYTKTIIKEVGCIFSVRETDDGDIIIAIDGHEDDLYTGRAYTVEVYFAEM